MSLSVAIVIPAGPGDRAWTGLLPQLIAADAQEVVLVLAEGDDLAKQIFAARIVRAPAGRSHQLNAGASASQAEWLWFLHADSRLTPRTLEAMQDFVAKNEDAIGYFKLDFLDDGPKLMFLNAWGTALRSRFLGLPFGDQGLLLPRRVFDALGGFDEAIGKGEDHALIWMAREKSIPLRAINASIQTSARRYAENGWWKTTKTHLRMTREQATRFSRQAKTNEAIDRS